MPTFVPCVPRPLLGYCPATIVGVARFKAAKAVKRQMQAAGLKPTHIEMRIITAAANDYLDQHRDELIEEAVETIARVPAFRKIAEQEAKRRRKLYQITPPKAARPAPTIPSTWQQAPTVSRKS